jgi:hypothetical protein
MTKVRNGKDQDVFFGTRKECAAFIQSNKDKLGYWLMHKRTAEGWQMVQSALTAGHLK